MGKVLFTLTESFDRKSGIIRKYGQAIAIIQDKQGYTPLHYAESQETAQLVLETVCESKRREFIFTLNEDLETAIHTAAWWQQNDVVRFLLDYAVSNHFACSLLAIKNLWGKTALHRAGNVTVARFMVEAIRDPTKREEFVMTTNSYRKTGLHMACGNRKTGVAKYMLSLTDLDIDKLLFVKNEWGNTALHNTDYGEIARLLLDAVSSNHYQRFIAEINNDNETALHVACEEGRNDVVEVILSKSGNISSLLLMQRDLDLNTPLHKAANFSISKTLTSVAASAGIINQLLTAVNKRNRNSLHIACVEGRNLVVEHLLTFEFTNLFTSDDDGNTPLLLAIDHGHIEIMSFILLTYENHPQMLEDLMQQRNKFGQNVFHLACRHIKYAEYYAVLKDYIHMVDITEISGPDILGNTPLHYLVGTYNVAQFADHIMRLSLLHRRRYLLHTYNSTNTNCKDVISQSEGKEDVNKIFLQSILNVDSNSLFEFYESRITFADMYKEQLYKTQNLSLNFDPQLLKVMMYALNEYSLMSVACTALLPQSKQKRSIPVSLLGSFWSFLPFAVDRQFDDSMIV